MFKHWFPLSSLAVAFRPLVQIEGHHNSVLYENSVKWNAIHEWNELLADRTILIMEEVPGFSIVDVVKQYLLKLRSDIYLYY